MILYQQIVGVLLTLLAGYSLIRATSLGQAENNAVDAVGGVGGASGAAARDCGVAGDVEGAAGGGSRPPRLNADVIETILTAFIFLTIARLVMDFGDWTGWVLYAWLLGIAVLGVGVYRLIVRWPRLMRKPGRPRSRTSLTLSLGVSGAAAAICLGIIVVPNLVIG